MDSSTASSSNTSNLTALFAYSWMLDFERWGNTLVQSVLVFIGCSAVLGNSFTLIVIAQHKKLQTPTNTILASLAAADLLVGCGVIFASMSSIVQGELDPYDEYIAACINILIMLPASASICHILLVAIDRLVAICHPLRYAVLMSQKMAVTMVVFAWVACSLYGFTFILWPVRGGDMPLSLNNYTTSMLASMYLIIAVAACCMYGKIFSIARSHHRAVIDQISTVNNNNNNVATKTIKASRKVAFILLAYFVTWLPGICSGILLELSTRWSLVSQERLLLWLYVHSAALLPLGTTNSCVNILIYARTSKQFGDAYKEIPRRICCPGRQ